MASRPVLSYRPLHQSALPARPGWYIALLAFLLLFVAPGCQEFAPNVSHLPEVHNPFPQLSRVAVAPFFNQSDEQTLDARRFSLAYFAQLQAVPGFEVVPLGVVEEAILRNEIDLSGPGEAQRLAKLLGVDAVVVGSVTDYSPYSPPRCGLRVEWYAANPGFHSIPAGYGLPWNTPQEEFIPRSLVYESEMALARAQMETQTPECNACSPDDSTGVPASNRRPDGTGNDAMPQESGAREHAPAQPLPPPAESQNGTERVNTIAHQEPADGPPNENLWQEFEELPPPENSEASALATATTAPSDTVVTTPPGGKLPPNWPDSSRFAPDAPCATRPPCIEHAGPVMSHTRIYHSDDPDFTAALSGYAHFHDVDGFGAWQTFLQRSDDFIRFCCHLHIAEMLTARGGAGKTRVVCEWPASR